MKRVWIYIAFTFGITWTMWIVAGIFTGAFENGMGSTPIMMIVVALGMFVPLIGALLTNVVMGRENRLNLCLRPRITGNVKYYLLAWFAPTIVSVLGAVVFFLINPSLFDATAGAFVQLVISADTTGAITEQMASLLLIVQAGFAISIAPFINMIPAFGEEVGWRGMLFPALCEKFSARTAVLISGVVWGLWHAPVIIMGHNYGTGYWGYPVLGILSMVVFCTAMGSCLSYLRVRTQSVWPCALAHGAANAVAGISIYFCVVGNTLTGPTPAGIIGGIPLICLGLWCWMRLSSKAESIAPS